MRTHIDIDDTLMAEAQKVSGQATKKQTEVDAAFGKYRWRGNLARSRKGQGTV